MVGSFQLVKEAHLHKQFSSLIEMYNKDKVGAMRVLDIQRIDSKSVKAEMADNGIYLSHHEP